MWNRFGPKARFGIAAGLITAVNVAWFVWGDGLVQEYKAKARQDEYEERTRLQAKARDEALRRIPLLKTNKRSYVSVIFREGYSSPENVGWISKGTLDYDTATPIDRQGPFAGSSGLKDLFLLERRDDEYVIQHHRKGKSKVLAHIERNKQPQCMAYDQKRHRLYVAGYDQESGRVHDLKTGKSKPFKARISRDCAFIPKMNVLATVETGQGGPNDNRFNVIDRISLTNSKGATLKNLRLKRPLPYDGSAWISSAGGTLVAIRTTVNKAKQDPTWNKLRMVQEPVTYLVDLKKRSAWRLPD